MPEKTERALEFCAGKYYNWHKDRIWTACMQRNGGDTDG